MGGKQKAKKSPRYVKKSTLNTSQDSFKSSELNESSDKFKEELIEDKTVSEQPEVPEAENKKLNQSISSKSSDDEDLKTLEIHSLPKNLNEEKLVNLFKTHSLNPKVKISHHDGKSLATLTFVSVSEIEKGLAIVIEQDFDGMKVVKHKDKFEFVEVIKEKDEGEKSESSSLSSEDEEEKKDSETKVESKIDQVHEITSSTEGISSQYEIIDRPTENKEETKHEDINKSDYVEIKDEIEKKIDEIHERKTEEILDTKIEEFHDHHKEEKNAGHTEKLRDEIKSDEPKHEDHSKHQENYKNEDHPKHEDNKKHEDLENPEQQEDHKHEDDPKPEARIHEQPHPPKDHQTPSNPINHESTPELHTHSVHQATNPDSHHITESNHSSIEKPEESNQVKHQSTESQDLKLSPLNEEIKNEEVLTPSQHLGNFEEPDSSSIYKGSVAFSVEVHPETINEKEFEELVQMEKNLSGNHGECNFVDDRINDGCKGLEENKEVQSGAKRVWVLVGLGVVGTLAFGFYKYKIKS